MSSKNTLLYMNFRKNALANDELQALMMLSIFDLLATLCEKDNLFMESTCQSVISISELLEVCLYMHISYS